MSKGPFHNNDGLRVLNNAPIKQLTINQNGWQNDALLIDRTALSGPIEIADIAAFAASRGHTETSVMTGRYLEGINTPLELFVRHHKHTGKIDLFTDLPVLERRLDTGIMSNYRSSNTDANGASLTFTNWPNTNAVAPVVRSWNTKKALDHDVIDAATAPFVATYETAEVVASKILLESGMDPDFFHAFDEVEVFGDANGATTFNDAIYRS